MGWRRWIQSSCEKGRRESGTSAGFASCSAITSARPSRPFSSADRSESDGANSGFAELSLAILGAALGGGLSVT